MANIAQVVNAFLNELNYLSLSLGHSAKLCVVMNELLYSDAHIGK